MAINLNLIVLVFGLGVKIIDATLTTPQDITMQSGSTFTIPWKFTETNVLLVIWYFNGRQVLTMTSSGIVTAVIPFNVGHVNNGEIKLFDVTTNNTGNYTIEVSYKGVLQETDTVHVLVTEPETPETAEKSGSTNSSIVAVTTIFTIASIFSLACGLSVHSELIPLFSSLEKKTQLILPVTMVLTSSIFALIVLGVVAGVNEHKDDDGVLCPAFVPCVILLSVLVLVDIVLSIFLIFDYNEEKKKKPQNSTESTERQTVSTCLTTCTPTNKEISFGTYSNEH